MLTHLDIRDFAIVDHVALELGPGMTVLTGETGAGKSILVDALGLVLGDRATATVVRAGAQRAEVTAAFDARDLPALRARLAELELADGDEVCILRRTVAADGRSRAFVNGRPVALQSLREVGELLIDIHGQHANQSLGRRDVQRQILDEHAGQESLLEAVRDLHRRWQGLRTSIEALGTSGPGHAAERDLLRYQVSELQALALAPGEVEALAEEHARLAHADALLATTRSAAAALEDAEDGGIVDRLEALAGELAAVGRFDPGLAPLRELLVGAAIQAREAAGTLRRYADRVELDPERLAWVEQRIDTIESLARKHRVPARDLPAHLAGLEARLDALEGSADRLRALEAELDAVLRRYDEAALALHESRAAAARRLAPEVTRSLRALGMPGARFEVRVEHDPAEPPAPHGRDRVELMVSANPGQPLAPLSQVASGGELSRISLAIQVIAARGRGVPTQIFDEVDAGIGGRVAEMVGRTLRRLSASRQVLCVTHLAQVAAQAEHHVQVSKLAADGTTVARVAALDPERRVDELARMLGGLEITGRTLAHAREMLERAREGP